jgi:hypothetical protein
MHPIMHRMQLYVLYRQVVSFGKVMQNVRIRDTLWEINTSKYAKHVLRNGHA